MFKFQLTAQPAQGGRLLIDSALISIGMHENFINMKFGLTKAALIVDLDIFDSGTTGGYCTPSQAKLKEIGFHFHQ
jgi:hypothetical protein